MIAEPGPYSKAVALMKALRSSSIECYETIGGVRIYPQNETERNTAISVCDSQGVYWQDGDQTFVQEFREAWREEQEK